MAGGVAHPEPPMRLGWVLSGKTHPKYPQEPAISCFSTVSAIQEYLGYAEYVCMRDLENNSRIRRCGNHLKASTIEMHNLHLQPHQYHKY